MLYNPNWKKVSMADFIGWLEGKNPLEMYNPGESTGHCLVGQYMASKGIEFSQYYRVTTEMFDNSHHKMAVLYNYPHTFGAALKRVKAIQKTKETA